jgi:hypothetical protein
MRVVITGVNLPGRMFCRPDGSLMTNVHVGVQVRRDPAEMVPGDATEARWEMDVDVVHGESGRDFRGLTVQGKRGERFIYLTWGNADVIHGFEMFRRAKLMLDRIDPTLMASAERAGTLAATVDLTDDRGGPRCARVDPPAITWSVPHRVRVAEA